MNSKSMRRLAADHGSLHTAGLPPNYLFPPSTDNADLTALDVLLAGPVGTPYANGVWRLHLDIPPGYPAAPPTAQFRTRLWHPNIDEATGAVCVETLKRDWTSTLKLRDVLVTISCLLIQPNPASALNETAGKMASEDWDGFCRRAKLMTEIHAAVPTSLAAEVKEAQMRGEDVTAEAGPVQPEKKSAAQSKGKECVKATPVAPKVQQVVDEDEENTRRRAETQEPASDPESDWIPGPKQTPKAATRRNNNIFGIKGLEDDMQIDTPPKRVFTANSSQKEQDDKENDTSDPFITVTSKRPAAASQDFNLNVPSAQPTKQSQQATDTPELLKYSHTNPFSAIQPNNQVNPLLKEFSYSWEETQTLHDADPAANGDAKLEVRKRLASEDFEKKRTWEMKRFKKAGYNLARYNRGDFGPKTGIGRL